MRQIIYLSRIKPPRLLHTNFFTTMQDKWSIASTLFSAIGSIATAIYSYFFVLDVKSRGKNLGDQGSETGGAKSFYKPIFKWLTYLFAAIGAITIAIAAFVSLAVIVVQAIAPGWNPVVKFQEGMASGIMAVVAPQLTVSGPETQRVAIPEPVLIKPSYRPAKIEPFTVSLSPATIDDYIHVKATIRNTTSQPVFISLNNAQRPVLIDDSSGQTSNMTQQEGINWSSFEMSGKELEEGTYTKIPPGETLAIGLSFYVYHPAPQNGGKINITFGFIYLYDGKAEKVSKSLTTSIR